MLSGSIYLFLSKVFGYGIRILLPIFLVRVLAKEDYGLYAQFFLIEVLIKVIFQMGVNQSLYFFIPRDRDNAGAYFLNSLLLNVFLFTVAYGLVWVFRAPIAAELGMPVIHRFYWYLASYSLLMMLNICAESYLTARKQVLAASVYAVVLEILASIATLYAAFVYRDLETIFLALVISRGVCLVLGLAYIHFRHRGFRAQRYFFGIRSQVRYGIVLGLAGMIWTVVMRMHELTVNRYYDVETYAVYAAGCRQIPVLQFFSQSVYVVALGRFAELEKLGDWEGIRLLWNKVLASMYGVGVPVTVFLLLVSKPLVILMFTPEYADAVPIFRFNTLAMMSLMLNPTLILRAMDRNDVTVKVHLAILAATPFALYGGMRLFGLVGIIAAHMLVMNGGRLATFGVLNRLAPISLRVTPPLREVLEFYGNTLRQLRKFVIRLTAGRGSP